jgi:predicted amidophosphoribosyltransferase
VGVGRKPSQGSTSGNQSNKDKLTRIGFFAESSLNTTSLTKTKTTQQMKDVGDYSARVATLQGAFASDKQLEGKLVLLFDDLFQSGATMNVAARILKDQRLVKAVFALALTRTRN